MRPDVLLSALLGCPVGAAVGIGAYAFVYARGASYLTDDPAACANCHVMREVYDAWVASSHSKFATCNDCHTPSGSFGKYATKVSNGLRHSAAFTTGWFPEPIRIGAGSLEVVQGACRKCHSDFVSAVDPPDGPHGGGGGGRASCVRCHASAGHLK
ncbi:MAG: cytochrome c nitrite reductase small subunit [Planctomycetota bacterium]